MLELVQSGGWLMAPILACSVLAAAICIERGWALQRAKVAPPHLLAQVWGTLRGGGLDDVKLRELRAASPLGEVLAAGLNQGRRFPAAGAEGGLGMMEAAPERMKEAMVEAVAQVSHGLERHLTSLGVIASVAPLLGLLGTVVGMIKVFAALMLDGAGDPKALAGGISEALITTAAGLTVAIPALIFHRFFLRRVDDLTLELEQEATHLLNAAHGFAPIPGAPSGESSIAGGSG